MRTLQNASRSEPWAQCKGNEMQPGRVFVFETGATVPPRYIINFPTKRHWRGKSRIEDIETGLESLVREIRSRSIRSIAIPPLGSGLGGLDWPSVRVRLEAALETLMRSRSSSSSRGAGRRTVGSIVRAMSRR